MVKGDANQNVFESTGTSTPGAGDNVSACPEAFNGYTRYPCVAEVNPSGTFNYKFDVVNLGNLPLSNYVFYDILPHIGDVGVNQALATSARLSNWPQYSSPRTSRHPGKQDRPTTGRGRSCPRALRPCGTGPGQEPDRVRSRR